MKKVVVELMQGERQVEYQEVTLSEAKEILARKMANGFSWHVPTWQFDETGGTPESELQAKQEAAYQAIKSE